MNPHDGSDEMTDTASRRLVPGSALTRTRNVALGACAPCPERASVLRRELLCRCPIALAARMLQRAERSGCSPEALPANERSSLVLQQAALARDLAPMDAGILERAIRAAHEAGHPGACAVPGCLACGAVAHLESALERLAAEPVAP
jgi:hypothetical protein